MSYIKYIFRLPETSFSTECYIDEDLNIIPSPIGHNTEDSRRSLRTHCTEDHQDKYEEVVCDCPNCQSQQPCLINPDEADGYNYEY